MIRFLNPNLKSQPQISKKQSAQELSSKERKPSSKTFILELDNIKKICITIESQEEQHLTCGWLFSEFLRKLHTYVENHPEDFECARQALEKGIIGIQTKEGNHVVDYYLSLFNHDLAPLKNGQIFLFVLLSEDEKQGGRTSVRDFEFKCQIGEGSFSKVYLARKINTMKYFAVKVIDKSEMLKKDKEELVFNERNLLRLFNCEFLVRLYYAFQTRRKLFMVLDYVPGGDLFYHIKSRGKLTENEAKIIFSEILEGVGYMHSLGIIYRDIKPENILLDDFGHIKLADFGISKMRKDKEMKNYSFCGSPEYMAPEMIKREGHNETIDYYCLGILLFEMVTGVAPFEAEETDDLFKKIVLSEISFPNFLSKQIVDLIKGLTEKNPEKRLGAQGGFAQIKSHPWLEMIDFEVLRQRKFTSPILPDLVSGLPNEILFEPVDIEELIDDTPIDFAADEEPWRKEVGLGSFAFNVDNPKLKEEEKLDAGRKEKELRPSVNMMYDKFANFSFFIEKEELETNLMEGKQSFERISESEEADHDEFLDEHPQPIPNKKINILDETETQKCGVRRGDSDFE